VMIAIRVVELELARFTEQRFSALRYRSDFLRCLLRLAPAFLPKLGPFFAGVAGAAICVRSARSFQIGFLRWAEHDWAAPKEPEATAFGNIRKDL